MKNWRCRKTINMDEYLFDRINGLIPSGLQSKVLGLILEDFFRNLPTENVYEHIAGYIATCLQKGAEDGSATPLGT